MEITTTTYTATIARTIIPQGQEREDRKSFSVTKEGARFTKTKDIVSLNTYNRKGEITKPATEEKEDPKVIANKEAIMREIWRQAYALLQEVTAKLDSSSEFKAGLNEIAEYTGNSEDPFGLGAYFAENPDGLEKVRAGIIPDYFSVETTAQRILDIWLPPSGGEDVDIDFVKGNISQAYAEVAGMFGGKLPQLVLDTQDYIMNKLDELAQKDEPVRENVFTSQV